ncbi:TRAP transporter large permease subunit [Candidatus Albibeggiatoa sp. nov. NOAA]|uniref:TRAP transporter large permease n=1 Tax=Candidatus Albibeggiatoa sp. nov. NOAA TaxID=3162724 RepID=UPI0032FEBEC1|nr:TRAP transporter large permease subunit [Thiotrichaceae bacterium]
MDPLLSSLILVIFLFALLLSGIWVAIALLSVGILGLSLFTSVSVGSIMATTSWGTSASWTLTALPLFIWMGEILFRTRLSQDLFRGLSPWLAYLPGRLVHVNIVGSAVFAAVSGSSAATAATIGKMSLPELRSRGYNESLSVGSLGGSATLGFLIPPSIIFIVYGISAEVSIARLFIAGVIPGALLVTLFMGYIIIRALMNPSDVPEEESRHLPFIEKVKLSGNLIPVMLLILGVLGSLYNGFATPTEAAALGVVGALLLSLLSGSLTWKTFVDSLMGATKTSCMIGFILVGAAFLTVMMGFTRIPLMLAEWIDTLNLSYYGLIFVLTLFFIMLGFFLDGISIVVLTTSVILPMVQQAGIDLLWFGVYVVIVVEMSQITPPVGFNLFVLQGLTGHNIFYLARAALPFFLLLLTAIVLIVVYPEIVTWLPEQATIRK